MKIRQALNVEAGLNDGLSVPFLLFFIALAAAIPAAKSRRELVEIHPGATWLRNARRHRDRSGRRLASRAGASQGNGWRSRGAQLGVVAVPLLCLMASEVVGASMFIAAFVAGLAVQVGFKQAGKHSR